MRLILALLAVLFVCSPSISFAQTWCHEGQNAATAPLRGIMESVRSHDYAAIVGAVHGAWSTSPDDAGARADAARLLTQLARRGSGLAELRMCIRDNGVSTGIFQDDTAGVATPVRLRVNEQGKGVEVYVFRPFRLISPPQAYSDAQRIRLLDHYVRHLAESEAFSGVVMIAHNGQVLYAQPFGLANREQHTPITLDTAFNLASLNKIMTATAIMQLVEQGAISLDDSVANILPANTSTSPLFRDIKIRHLLTHTSGLGADRNVVEFTPGSQFSYSNLGFRILGEVIAAKSHMRFEDYMRLKVFGPADMSSTGRYEIDTATPLLTYGYTYQRLNSVTEDPSALDLQVNPFLQTIPGAGMGGLYSTAPDLMRFATALSSGRLVSAASLQAMRTPKPELNAPDYGFGVMIDRQTGVWGHGGDIPGTGAELEFYSHGYVAVVLANLDNVTAPVTLYARALFNAGGER